MTKPLEYLAIKSCEKIPIWLGLCGMSITSLEKNGFCKKPSKHCKYCEKSEEVLEKYHCDKKTYIKLPKLNIV